MSSYQTPELDAIRQRIDALDNNVHDLLMERADLVMRISEEKKKNGIQIVQPAREARMIRRLMKRHRGPLPEETIVRIWRELVGSISLLQTGLSVSVATDRPEFWDMARDYFGTVLPMRRDEAKDALDSVINGQITFAVMPWFDASKNWWRVLIENPSLKIIQRLPYGDKANFDFGNHPCLVVSNAGFDASDDDKSFIAVKAQHLDVAKELFKIINQYNDGEYSLIEVDEFVLANDARLAPLEAVSLGGYPTPPEYNKI